MKNLLRKLFCKEPIIPKDLWFTLVQIPERHSWAVSVPEFPDNIAKCNQLLLLGLVERVRSNQGKTGWKRNKLGDKQAKLIQRFVRDNVA